MMRRVTKGVADMRDELKERDKNRGILKGHFGRNIERHNLTSDCADEAEGGRATNSNREM
jgi:hypothetical protein